MAQAVPGKFGKTIALRVIYFLAKLSLLKILLNFNRIIHYKPDFSNRPLRRSDSLSVPSLNKVCELYGISQSELE